MTLARMGRFGVMAQIDLAGELLDTHPLDVIEQVMDAQGWRFRRTRDDDMAAEYRGKWCDYSLHFAWSTEFNAIHFTCAFDVRVPDAKRRTVNDLLAMVNDKIWLGHFGVWEEEGLPMFRHSVLLRGTPALAEQQVEDLLDIAISECERFYPAFQYVVWAGKAPREAVEVAMVEPMGEA